MRSTRSASSPRRTTPPRRCSKRAAPSCRTNIPKAIPASATTKGNATSIRSRPSRSSAPKASFGVEHANVQPYSGSPANLAVYSGLLKPGETIMGMLLPHGGHLTHGWNASMTSVFWKSVSYGVDRETHRIDYDAVRDLAKKERPRIIVAGRDGLSAHHRFRGVRQHCQGGRGVLPRRYRTYRGADRGRRASVAGALCRCRQHHDA